MVNPRTSSTKPGSTSASNSSTSTPIRMTRSRTSASLSPDPTSSSTLPSIQQTIKEQPAHQKSESESESESDQSNSVHEQQQQDKEEESQEEDCSQLHPIPIPSPSQLRRLKLRRQFFSFSLSIFSILPYLLIPASLILPLTLTYPFKPISKNVYVDENALQPAQANLYYNGFQVAWSKAVFESLERIEEEGTVEERLDYVEQEFKRYGLDPKRQEYQFLSSSSNMHDNETYGNGKLKGVNIYARWKAPRTNGREAVILNAPWKSRWRGERVDEHDSFEVQKREERNETIGDGHGGKGDQRMNKGGISMVLSLAKFLTTQSHLSRDIIFVISEGHLEGFHAWSSSYFDNPQSNLISSPLSETGPLIQTSISVDAPLLSFSSFQPLLTGLNGLTPNLDIYNAFQRIVSKVGSSVRGGSPVPIRLGIGEERKWGVTFSAKEAMAQGDESMERDRRGEKKIWEWSWKLHEKLANLIGDRNGVKDGEIKVGEEIEKVMGLGQRGIEKWRRRNGNFWKESIKMIKGNVDGTNGLLMRYHVDAITIYATPDEDGPYGSKELGRVVESQIRSMSNLLERLHHSQFFYFLSTPTTFIQIGLALPCALLLSAALTIQGLKRWTKEGSIAKQRKNRLLNSFRDEITGLSSTKNESENSSPRDLQTENPTTEQLVESLIEVLPADSFEKDESLFFKVKNQCRKFRKGLDETDRPIGAALGIMAACQVLGSLIVSKMLKNESACHGKLQELQESKTLNRIMIVLIASVLPISSLGGSFLSSSTKSSRRTLGSTLHSFILLYSGLLVLSISLLNLPLAYALGLLVGLPVLFFGPNPSNYASSSVSSYLKIALSVLSVPPILLHLLVLSTHPSLSHLHLERLNPILPFLPPTLGESQATGLFQVTKRGILEGYCQLIEDNNLLGGVGIDLVAGVWIPVALMGLVSTTL